MLTRTPTGLPPPRLGYASPWGAVVDVDDVAPGLLRVRGERGGGWWMDHDRRAGMPDELRRVPTWVGEQVEAGWVDFRPGNWYDEAEDSALVVLAWPELEDPQAVWALLAGQGYRWYRDPVRRAVASWRGPSRDRAQEIADTWGEEHATWWLRTHNQTSAPVGWHVWYQQVGTGDRALRLLTDEGVATAPYAAVQDLPGVPGGASRGER